MEPVKGAETNPILIEWVRHSHELLGLTTELAGCEILALDTLHHKEVAKIVAFRFAQAVRTFRSVLLLAEVGDATNSFILMRSLFESLVDVAYLIENPKDIWRYLEESAELEAKLRHAQLSYGPPPTEDISPRRPSPEELQARFSGLAAEHSSCKSWCGLSLRTRAEKTGYPDIVALYEIVYPTASAYVHGASSILLDYLRGLAESPTEFRVDYDRTDSELEPSVGFSATIFLRLVAFLDALFRVGLRPRVEQLHDVQQTLHRKSFARLAAKYTQGGLQGVP